MSIEHLEKKVRKLEKTLKAESEKTSNLEAELKQLVGDLQSVKREFAGEEPTSPTKSRREKKSGESSPSSLKKSKSSESSSNEPISFSGELEKKGAVRHNWKKRWFVLDKETHYLSWYDREGVRNYYYIIFHGDYDAY